MMDFKTKIDSDRMNASKQRTIQFVMDNIQDKPQKRPLFISFSLKRVSLVMASLFVIVVLLTQVINITDPKPPTPGPTLDVYESRSIVEAGYIAGSILQESLTVSTPIEQLFVSRSYQPFITKQTTVDINNYEKYFDLLITLYKDADFTDLMTVEDVEDSEYQSKITFTKDNQTFVMYITQTEDSFEGLLQIDQVEYNLSGTLETTTNSVELDFRAFNGNDYIEVSFEKEKEDGEVSTSYSISEYINGVYSEKTIDIEYDPEFSVEMTDNDDSYEIVQEVFNGSILYILEYDVNDVAGELFIIETVDAFGNVTYEYLTEEEFEALEDLLDD